MRLFFQSALSSVLSQLHVTIAAMGRCGEASILMEILRGLTVNSISVRESSYCYSLLIPLHQTFAAHTT